MTTMWTVPFAYIGTTEIMLVIGGIVLLFGGAKIPQLMRGLGEGIREFKTSVDGTGEETRPEDSKPATSGKTTEPDTTTTGAAK